MSDPVNALLFSVGLSLLLWGGFHHERRRLRLALLVGASAAALVAPHSEHIAWSGLAFGVGAVVGAAFRGWGGGHAPGSRGPLGGGWSEGGRFGAGGGASGSW